MNEEICKFVTACSLKGEFEEVGNSKKGNEQYKIINASYILLKDNGRLDELLALLDHENPYVRLWAASFTLQFSPLKAEKALEELTELRRNIGFDAKMTLQVWRSGNLML